MPVIQIQEMPALLPKSEVEHYRRLEEPLFTLAERDTVTILIGGLTWKHEELIKAVFQSSGYRCMRLPIPSRADFEAGKQYGNNGQCNPTYFTVGCLVRYLQQLESAGLTKQQIARIYAFESGGNGGYDVQAGLEYATPGARAINSALGYNQLLNTNSVELLAEKGDQFIGVLKTRAAGLTGEAKAAFERKIEVVQRMIAFARTVPDDWNEHDKLANTPRGFAVHAMNLDIDVGPLLQTQKLLDSVRFAHSKGYTAPLTAAELEMMNLTGDGNGFDMVTMPAAMREKVPTSNFFQQGGYGRNPVASRNNVVAKLIAATDAKMDHEVQLQGARDMAAAF